MAKTTCDMCGGLFKQGMLYNLYPVLNHAIGDLKEGLEDTDGMYCVDCYLNEMVNEEAIRKEIENVDAVENKEELRLYLWFVEEKRAYFDNRPAVKRFKEYKEKNLKEA